VLRQVGGLAEGLAALGAGERLLPSVNPLVRGERRAEAEGLPAVSAQPRLLGPGAHTLLIRALLPGHTALRGPGFAGVACLGYQRARCGFWGLVDTIHCRISLVHPSLHGWMVLLVFLLILELILLLPGSSQLGALEGYAQRPIHS
jgi:hypothetical protein